MKKSLIIGLLFLLVLLSLNVDAAGVVKLVSVTPVSIDPSSSGVSTLTINNTGDATINAVLITSSDLLFGTSKINAPSIPTVTILVNGTPQTKQFTINVGAVPTGNYVGTITATDATNSANKDTISYIVFVNPKAILSVSGLTDNKLMIASQIDKSINKIFTIKNDGSLNLNPTVSINGTFKDNDNDQITFSSSSLGQIVPGASSDVTLTTTIPKNMDLGTYTGTVTVTDSANAVTKTFPIEVNVEPKICKNGRVSNENPVYSSSDGNLRVDVNDPDDGDEFSPGEELKLSVDVENHKDDELDVIVEATLYNLDKNREIVSVESDSITIDENDDQNFDLDLDIPIDDSDLKEGDDYALFVKAYEDGNEDENCNYYQTDLDFQRQTHSVIIEKVTINPTIASCSDVVSFAVDVKNVGERDEDSVQLRLKETTLGLDLTSEVFSLRKFDKSGDSALKTFTYKIPENMKEGDYFVETKLFFMTKSVSSLDKLTLTKCQVTSPEGQVVLTLPQTSFTSTQGKVFTVPLNLKNPGTQTATYTISVNDDNDWADVSTEQRISVASGEQTTVYAYITPKPSLSSGTYTATITVKQNDNIIKIDKITATISGQTPTGGVVYQPSVTLESIWRNLAQSTIFWIVAIVIVFVLIIYALTVLLRPR